MKILLWTHRRSVAVRLYILLLILLCSTIPYHRTGLLVDGFFAAPRSKILLILMATSSSSEDDGNGATTTAATEAGPINLEVERKFSLLGANLDSLSDRLRQAGLKEAGTKEMVDWYFDRPQYPLIRQDCWLRYRTTAAIDGSNNDGSGTWQLKQGRKVNQNSSGTTVYEETEGKEALKITQTLLNGCTLTQTTTTTTTTTALFDGVFEVPPIPISGMQPFARIATKRSSWIMPNDDNDDDGNNDNSSCNSNSSSSNENQHIWLTVDLDTTDFGHAIGEVEAVVTNVQDVTMAHAKIDDLIEQLQVGGSSSSDGGAASIIMGKLEYYLKLKRPEILQLIMEGTTSTPTPGAGSD
jgi:adenylate cyclase class IV